MITVEKGNLIEVTGGNKKQRQLTEAGITAYYADKRANGNNYTGD